MTYEEAKEQVAKRYGYRNWSEVSFYEIDEINSVTHEPYAMERLTREAALLYGKAKEPKWISVKERLPENRQRVLCFNGYHQIENYYELFTGQNDEWFKKTFTHWMPLLEPPQG